MNPYIEDIRTSRQAYIQAGMQTAVGTHIRTYVHTYIQAYNTYIHTYIETYTCGQAGTYIYNIHMDIHTYI